MISIILLSLVGIVAIYLWENKVIEVVRVEVPIKGLAPDLDGFSIAQLSDLHGRRLNGRWVKEQLTKANVDAIALTGDYVRAAELNGMAQLEPLLALLPQIAPTFAVSGNHDIAAGWPQIARLLRQQGITVLDDTYTTITRGNAQLVIAGISYPHDSLSSLERALPSTTDPIVLLAHSPRLFMQERIVDYLGEPVMKREEMMAYTELAERPALTLVGHTHGGQIKLPLLGAVTTASGELFPRHYIEGPSWEGSGWLYISRGLGYTGLPLRFLSRPELTIITLKRAG